MSKIQFDQSKHWDKILDPRNISGSTGENPNLLDEIEFYQTPAQDYAYQLMGNLKEKRVLEIGSGVGINHWILSQKGANVVAIDISIKRLQYIQNRVVNKIIPRLPLIQSNGESLPFRGNTFDIVYTNAVLIHMNKEMASKEIYRILKPGGVAIFVEPLKYHPLVNLYRHTLGPKIWRKIAAYFTFQDIRNVGAFFDSFQHKEFYLTSFVSFYWEFGNRNLARFKKSLSRWNNLDTYILKYIPLLSRLCWFTVFSGYKK